MEFADFFVDVLQICRADGAGFADECPANPVAEFSRGDGRTILILRWEKKFTYNQLNVLSVFCSWVRRFEFVSIRAIRV